MNELLQQIFNLDTSIGRTIVYWIRIFFWVGVGNYIWHLVRIGYNYFCLKFVQIKIKKGLDVVSPGLLNRLAKSVVIRTGIRVSIIYRRINDLVKIKQNGGEIDHDVLGDIHAGATSRKAGLSNYILGILIILGLVGTLWGLTTAVIEVQPLLQDIDDLDQLPQISRALQETLKGMGTAFKTTLAGLVTSLGLGALGWLFSLLNSAFLTRFETVVATEIIPHFKQTPESAIESSMDQLQVSVDEFKLATEDNVRRMQESIQQLTEKSWDAYLEQQYVIANELREIPGELRESLGGISEYQVLIKSTVESFEKMTEGFMTEVSKNQSTVDTMVSGFKELTTQSMSQVSEYQKVLQEGLENAVPQLAAESEALKATIRESQESQAKIIEYLVDALKRRVQALTDRHEALRATIHESQESQAKIIEYLVDTLKRRVQALTDRQENIQEGLRESVDIIVSDFKELTEHSMSQVSEYQAALLEGLENVVSEFKEESAGLKTTIHDVQSSQTKFIDELAKNLAATLTNTLDKQLQSMLQPIVVNQQDMVEELRETVIDIREIAGELQIRSALEMQNEVFEEIRSELIQNRQETGNRLSQLMDELQIIPALETQNKVFGRIESHLEGQRDLVDKQIEIMQTLDGSVKQLQRTFSKTESDEQQRAENMLQQLTQEFNTLGEKMDTLNHTMGKPGLYRWGSEIRRWFGVFRK